MGLEVLYPSAGDHSIQAAAFMVEWASPMGPDDLEKLAALQDQFAALGMHVRKEAGTNLNVSPSGVMVQSTTLGIVEFLKNPTSSPTQPFRIQLTPERCTIVFSEYSRWEKVWSDVQDWLKIILPAAVNLRAVRSCGLQYNDVFHWRDSSPIDVGQALNKESKYLPTNVFSGSAAWHSHHGYFIELSAHRILENVNIQIAEDRGFPSIAIMTSHLAMFPVPVGNDAFDKVKDVMPNLHIRNKDILVDVLSVPVQEKIKLKGG